MPLEIERKFLVQSDEWREGAKPVRYCQGYLCPGQGPTVRVRTKGDQGVLTIKARTTGLARMEFEYPVPLDEAKFMLQYLCAQPVIDKYRHRVMYRGFEWVVDEFHGQNKGLIMAEIELEHEQQKFPLPPWAGREVTNDGRYYNASLALNPFSRWCATEPEFND